MTIVFAVMALAILTLEYVLWKNKKNSEFVLKLLDMQRKDHNRLLCNVSRLLRCSRVAKDGRLIVPRKVYEQFMEQSFDNEEVQYDD